MNIMSNIIEIADDKSEIKIRDDLLCTFPATGTGGSPIYFHDLDCLEKDKWLSDQIISKFFSHGSGVPITLLIRQSFTNYWQIWL